MKTPFPLFNPSTWYIPSIEANPQDENITVERIRKFFSIIFSFI